MQDSPKSKSIYVVTLVQVAADRHQSVRGAVNTHPVPKEIEVEVAASNAVEAQKIAAKQHPGYKAKVVLQV